MNGFWGTFGIPLEAAAFALLIMLPAVLWPFYGWRFCKVIDLLTATHAVHHRRHADAAWAEALRSQIERWDGIVPDDILERPYHCYATSGRRRRARRNDPE